MVDRLTIDVMEQIARGGSRSSFPGACYALWYTQYSWFRTVLMAGTCSRNLPPNFQYGMSLVYWSECTESGALHTPITMDGLCSDSLPNKLRHFGDGERVR